jgi:hypothetical protein
MTILSVDKMWSRTTSDASVTDNFRKYNVAFQEAYQVVCTPDTTELEVYQAPGLPAAGSFFPHFPFVVCERAQLQRVSPIFWIVTMNYSGEIAPDENSNQGGGGGGGGFSTSPLNAPPKIDWDDVESEEETDEDFDGKPIATANNEPIEGVKVLIPDQTVTIRRNMAFFSPYIQARYRRSVNSDPFLGWPPGTAKLMKLSASNVIDKEFGYWEVTAQVQFRYPYRTEAERAWYARVRHEGYYERIDLTGPDAGSKIVRAVDGNKEPMQRKVLLNEEGYRLPADEEAQWKEFKLYDSLPYNALGLI